jgi:hypothetical protein
LRVENERCLEGFGWKVTFAEDLRNPAWGYVRQGSSKVSKRTHIEFWTVDILEIYGHGELPWLFVVYIAGSVRSQVRMAVLELGDLEPPDAAPVSNDSHRMLHEVDNLPLIQSNGILDKKESLLGEQGGA